MNQTVSRRTLNVSDVPVGTEVVLAKSIRLIDQRISTRVTKVTKTYLETASGHRFNVSLGNRYGDEIGRIGKERKSIHNSYPRGYRDHDVYLVGDPYLASMIERHRLDEENRLARAAFERTLNAVARTQNHETVQAALDALNAWVANHPKEA